MRVDHLELEHPKAYFACKAAALEFAAGLDCYVKYTEHNKKPLLLIFSHCFKKTEDRSTETSIENQRKLRVKKLKTHLNSLIYEQDQSQSTIGLGMLDEQTRKSCMLHLT